MSDPKADPTLTLVEARRRAIRVFEEAEASRGKERKAEAWETAELVPDLAIVWDTAMVGEERYARLVALLGDLVRAEGGLGIERIHPLA